MTNTVKIEFTAKDAEILQSYKKQNRELQKQNRQFEKMAAASKRVGDNSKKGFNDGATFAGKMAQQVGGIATSLVGAGAAVAILRQEYDALVNRQNQASQTQFSAGQAIRLTKVAFNADSTVSDAQLEPLIESIAQETGSSIQAVAGALTDAFSAKGSKSNAVAADAVRQALRFLPNNQAAATTLSSRALDVSKFSGSDNIAANLGFIQNVQSASRVTSLDQVGAQIVPAIANIVKQGDTPEQAAELAAAMTQLLQDDRGEKTKTAVTNLSSRLAGFVPSTRGKDARGSFSVPQDQIAFFEKAATTTARIEAMQKSPELRRAFFGSTTFDSTSSASIKSLLSGDAKSVAELNQARKTIKPLDNRQADLFEKSIERLNSGKFSSIVAAQQGNNANVESNLLGDSKGSAKAAVRETIYSTLSGLRKSNLTQSVFYTPPVEYNLGKTENPVNTGKFLLNKFKEELNPENQYYKQDRELIEKQLQMLERIDNSIKEGNQKRAPAPVNNIPAAKSLSRDSSY